MQNKIPFSLTDAFMGTGLFLLISIVGVTAIHNAKDNYNRYKCEKNLHYIGQAILLYENENEHRFPCTVRDVTSNPKPTWGTPYHADKKLTWMAKANCFDGGKVAPAPNDVSASMFLVLRTEKLDSKLFVCPSTDLKPWDFGGKGHTAAEWTNWQGNDGLAKHLSYSYANPFAAYIAIAKGFNNRFTDSKFVLVADMNPGGSGVTKVTLKSSQKELAAANSLNHGGDGQNVLYGDGRVQFQTTPFCGFEHDNIYTAAGPEIEDPDRKAAVIVSSPVDSGDSVLLPTAADIGYKGPPK